MKKLFLAFLVALLSGSAARAQSPWGPYSVVLPHWADGAAGGLRITTEIIIINNSREEAFGLIDYRDGQGVGVHAVLFVALPGQALSIGSPAFATLQTGWARVQSGVPLSVAAIFTVSDAAGVLLSRVGVGAASVAATALIPVDTTDGKDSGFSVCNPDAESSVTISAELRTMAGQAVASGAISLPPGGHRAEFVTETFPGGQANGFKGVLALSADGPFGALALRTRGVDLTSLPTFTPTVDSQSSFEAVFPRIADGVFADQRFQTFFWLLNNGAVETSATLDFFKADGQEWDLQANGEASHRRTVKVPPGGAFELASDGLDSPGIVGWARVTCDHPLGSGATFAIKNQSNGNVVSEVGVPGSAPLREQIIYVREEGASATGIALTNVSDETVAVRLRLTEPAPPIPLSLDPLPVYIPPSVYEKTVTLSARSHLGQFISELFSDVPAVQQRDFEGWLEIRPHVARFGEDIVSPVAAMTLLAHGLKLTTAPTAGYAVISRPLSYWDSRIDNILSQMTLDEKVGQMTQAERGSLIDESDIGGYYLGSVLSGGGSGPPENNVESWAQMYDRFQTRALNTRLGIPILYGVDAVHGHNNVRGAVIFAHNIGLGATRNPTLVEQAARITACEVRATGINWTFSPVVAVPRDERWGRTYEGFGEDPGLVRTMARAATRGYQGAELLDSASILACAKHFLADGGTAGGIDQGNAIMDEATLRAIHLPGYLGAMDAEVGSIMVSFSSWNGLKMSANRYLLTDVLKGELGFEGFLVSDWAAIDQLPGDYLNQVKVAVNAGLDMFMVPYRHREFFSTLKSLVQDGEVPISRIDDAVRRILRVKFAMGLLGDSPWSAVDHPHLTDPSFQTRFGSSGHREVAREAVRQSLVLLRNEGNVLPLSKTATRIHVAGLRANDLGSQCGGWTIDWQGQPGAVTTGTTILEAIRQTVSPETSVTFSANGAGAGGADVAVVVIGETPYAEGWGDDQDLSLSAADIAVVETAHAAGVTVVVVLISGRPLILAPILDKVDALVAAWLPGTEGQGVADVLFGDYRPTGKLPCSWPRSVGQVPINTGDAVYDPLFAYGYGLTYE
jgi:beta-glucosidase